jgi:hypothetical protein
MCAWMINVSQVVTQVFNINIDKSVNHLRSINHLSYLLPLPWYAPPPLSPPPIPTNPPHPQSQSQTVDVPQSIKDALRKFRFRRSQGSAALVIKINKASLSLEQVELFDDISIPDLAEGPCTLPSPAHS